MKYILASTFLCITTFLFAGADDFTAGSLIKDFGKTASVASDTTLDTNHKFNVVFDLGEQGPGDRPNRSINSLARFLNMHVRAGVKPENINLALVVHGKAANDVLNNKAYEEKFSTGNPNHALLKMLLQNNVDIFLCGQTAAYYDIEKENLQKGVNLSLSSMTAHALLQQQGYTLNPF